MLKLTVYRGKHEGYMTFASTEVADALKAHLDSCERLSEKSSPLNNEKAFFAAGCYCPHVFFGSFMTKYPSGSFVRYSHPISIMALTSLAGTTL